MCGVIGIYNAKDVAFLLKNGLDELQHRGQNGAGIYTYGEISNRFYPKKEAGLVSEVFPSSGILETLEGNFGIGHVRYPTIGFSGSTVDEKNNAQPFWSRLRPSLALAHNGNIMNTEELAERLNQYAKLNYGAKMDVVRYSCDAEVIVNLLAKFLPDRGSTVDDLTRGVGKVMGELKGSYSVVGILGDVGMFAFRDPYGIRPLVWGKNEDGESHVFASEVVAFESQGYEVVRTVNAGEVITIPFESGKPEMVQLHTTSTAPCFFEGVYFSHPDSTWEEKSIYEIRKNLGKNLGEIMRQNPLVDINTLDKVIPIPDGGSIIASGVRDTIGIPLDLDIIRSKYKGKRYFIGNTKSERWKVIRNKFKAIRAALDEKSIVLVDDSIVRGPTSKYLVSMARNAGAKEVHVAIGNAPTSYICQLGIDIPEPEELAAFRLRGSTLEDTIENIREFIDADSLTYLSPNDVAGAYGRSMGDMCMGCITDVYPIRPDMEFSNRRHTHRITQENSE